MPDLYFLTTGAEFEVFRAGFSPDWPHFPRLASAGVAKRKQFVCVINGNLKRIISRKDRSSFPNRCTSRQARSPDTQFGSQPFVRENTGKMVSSGGGRGERKKKNRLFPSTNWEKLAKISKIEVLIMAWSFLQSFSSIGANLTHFVKHFTFFSTFWPPKVRFFWTLFNRIIIFWKNQTLGPLKNERSQNSASKSLLNSSGDLNATHLVMKNLEKKLKMMSQNSFSHFYPSGWLPGNLGPL